MVCQIVSLHFKKVISAIYSVCLPGITIRSVAITNISVTNRNITKQVLSSCKDCHSGNKLFVWAEHEKLWLNMTS